MSAMNIAVGETLKETCFVLQKLNKEEGRYLALLSDKTGGIKAEITNERMACFEGITEWVTSVIKVTGPVLMENGEPIVHMKQAELAGRGDFKPCEMYDGLSEEKVMLYRRILADALNRIPDDGCKALCKRVLSNQLVTALEQYPASLAYAAKYRGGALAQTAMVVRFVMQLGISMQKYENGLYGNRLEWSVLLAGALLHMAAIPDYFADQPWRRTAVGIDRGYMSLLQTRIERANRNEKPVSSTMMARILNVLQVAQPKSVVRASTQEGVLLRQAVQAFTETDMLALAVASSSQDQFFDTKTRRHVNTVKVEEDQVHAEAA